MSQAHQLIKQAERDHLLPQKIKNLLRHSGKYNNRKKTYQQTFNELLSVSENTALFFPDDDGKYTKPLILGLIDPAREVMADINTKFNKHRRSSLFDVMSPECAHTLGVMIWSLQTAGLKHINEQHLRFKLAQREVLTPEVNNQIDVLSLVEICTTLYHHDSPENNLKHNKKYNAYYFARTALSRILVPSYSKIMTPIVTEDIKSLTDDPRLRGEDRLEAQKIPPQKEWEELCRLGIINEKTQGTGLIGTGRFHDKLHQITWDMLCVTLGRKSDFRDPWDCLIRMDPRIDIVSSLHVADRCKSLFMETVERTYEGLHEPAVKATPEQANKIITHELIRIRKVLEGEPHIPVKSKAWSIPSPADLARWSRTL